MRTKYIDYVEHNHKSKLHKYGKCPHGIYNSKKYYILGLDCHIQFLEYLVKLFTMFIFTKVFNSLKAKEESKNTPFCYLQNMHDNSIICYNLDDCILSEKQGSHTVRQSNPTLFSQSRIKHYAAKKDLRHGQDVFLTTFIQYKASCLYVYKLPLKH